MHFKPPAGQALTGRRRSGARQRSTIWERSSRFHSRCARWPRSVSSGSSMTCRLRGSASASIPFVPNVVFLRRGAGRERSRRGPHRFESGRTRLDERERLFIARFHELIPTPRAAKRFVNVYRLIRASITDAHELTWFLQAREFAAVQVLLAIVRGAPAEDSEILRELLARPAEGAWNTKWWELVDGVVKPRLHQAGWQWLNSRLESLRHDPRSRKRARASASGPTTWPGSSFYSGRVLLGPPRESFGMQPSAHPWHPA